MTLIENDMLHELDPIAKKVEERTKVIRKELADLKTDFEALNQAFVLYNVMPSLEGFKARRQKLRMSLRQVAEKTGVSFATISRLEQGKECEYSNVKTINNFYCSNGA